MFRFDAKYREVGHQFQRFADRHYGGDYYLVWEDEEAWRHWESLGIPTPCRKCGASIDECPSDHLHDSSSQYLGPLFETRRANGDKTGIHYRFERDVGFKGFCESCCHDLVPWFQKLADVLEVNKVVNYLERSIRCQRNNNPVEKSKLLDNLGKCL